MDFLLKKYDPAKSAEEIVEKVALIIDKSKSLQTIENYLKAFSCIDLTTLNATDTPERARTFCRHVNEFGDNFSEIPNVAAICVYPALVPEIKSSLVTKHVGIASVVGGFPASQTFIDVKTAETKLAIKHGATEADMVISIGAFLSGNYQRVFDEIKAMKTACGQAHLKVILETGALESPQQIKNAAILAMEAGADFIKTSTGKHDPAATLEAVYTMTEAIQEYYQKTGRMVGIKPAGGISTPENAVQYMAVVKHNLSDAWLKPAYFRIGASSLANNLLSKILIMQNKRTEPIVYF